MSNVLKSASKIVLLLVGLTVSMAFLAVVVSNLKSEQIALAVIAIFSGTVSSVMTYYFTKRAEKQGDNHV